MIRLALSLGLSQAGFHAWIATIPVAMAAAGRSDTEIGAVVGAASVFNLLAALASGVLIDRYGGRAVYLVGTLSLFAGALPVALDLVGPQSSFAALIVIRLLQGAGLAAVLPAVMTLVPGQVPRQRLATALAVVGVAGNISLALTPALTLWLLANWGFSSVGLAVCVSVTAGALILWPLVDPERVGVVRRADAFRPAWRRAWRMPIAFTLLFVAHWGVITAYLPQRAEAAGADIGLFFMADALGLLALRIPAGWLAGRMGSRPLLLFGALITLAGIVLLLAPLSTDLLVLSGLLTGAGSAFVFPIISLELTLRSDATDRGSAFAFFAVAFGAGIALGSLAIAPVYSLIGFEVSILGGLALVVVSGALALADRTLSRSGRWESPAADLRPVEPGSGTTGDRDDG